MGKRLSEIEKKGVVKKYSEGIAAEQLATEYCVSRSTIYNWVNRYQTKTNNPIKNHKDYLILNAKYERTRKINEILYKANCAPDSPTEVRVAAIQKLLNEYSLTILCEALKVSKSSYYTIIDDRHETIYTKKRKELTPIITAIFNESYQTIGSKKITSILQTRGYKISQKLVADIMQKEGLFSVRSGAKKLYLQGQKRKENILHQKFTVSRPNEVWVSDVTQFRFKNLTYYVCVVLDLFARKVISLKVSTKNSTQLIKSAFKDAYTKRQPQEGLLFHSDQGCNFTSKTFCRYLESLGVNQSFSRKGTPYDNSVCEAFFKTFKEEEIYRHIYHSVAEMKTSIENYILRYNNERPHVYLKYKTPNDIENRYFNEYKLDKQ